MSARKQIIDACHLGKILRDRYFQNIPNHFNFTRNGRRLSTSPVYLVKTLGSENINSVNNLNEESEITIKLINWAMSNNVSYLAFSQLLSILSECGIENLPKNSRVLLKSKEEEIEQFEMRPGIYIHFGFKNNLKKVILGLRELNLLQQDNINLSIFIDSLLLSSFTNKSLWVILGSVEGFNNIIFFIGAFYGVNKPKNSNLFLSQFITESINLCNNGLEINNTQYKVIIKRLICDAVAKSFILGVKGCTGYSSCTKCHVVGEYKNKICFPEKSTPKDDEYYKRDEVYKDEKTKLLEIPNFGIVSSIPLDYLHLVCLGVVKKLISIWFGQDGDYLISKERVLELIKALPPLKPSEFEGKLKPFNLLSRWTPFEFRQFLLYHGPVILKNSLNEKYYNHFLSLHVACRLLCMYNNENVIELGKQLLHNFVRDFERFYGKEHMTHNVHGLYHLADDCKDHGTLDNFSAFPFEKFLLQLRNSMEKLHRKPLPKLILKHSYEKVLRRNFKKINLSGVSVSKKLKEPENCSDRLKNFSEYEFLTLGKSQITPLKNGDKFVCLNDGKIIEVVSVLGKKEKSGLVCFVGGKEFASVSSFYLEPVDSIQLKIFKVKELVEEVNYWPVDLIHAKCVKVPLGEGEDVMIGLLEEDFLL